MRVPDELRKCVAWIGVKAEDEDGKVVYSWHGTAFFLEVPFTIGTGLHRYVVTADHVLSKMADDLHLAEKNHLRAGQYVMRLNHQDGSAAYVPVDQADVTWWTHPDDPAADVAVAALPVPLGAFDIRPLPVTMCLSDEEITKKGIGVGHEVVVTGLFRDMPGDKRNLPIVRTGNIAMMPAERVVVEGRGPMGAYLIEARSTGGLSGSPVFVQRIYANKDTGDLDATYSLLGLIHGHWEYEVMRGATSEEAPNRRAGSDDRIVIEDSSRVEEGVNVGVAVVVPAKAILAALAHPALIAARERDEMERAGPHMPKPD